MSSVLVELSTWRRSHAGGGIWHCAPTLLLFVQRWRLPMAADALAPTRMRERMRVDVSPFGLSEERERLR